MRARNRASRFGPKDVDSSIRSPDSLNTNRQGPLNAIWALVDTDKEGNEIVLQTLDVTSGDPGQFRYQYVICTDERVLEQFLTVARMMISNSKRNLSVKKFVLGV